MLIVLADMCSSNRYASFYTNSFAPEKFIFGKVVAVNTERIVFQTLSPEGQDDGLAMVCVDHVFKIEENGKYAQKMYKLISGQNIPAYSLNINNDDIAGAMLSFAQIHGHIASVELLDSGIFDAVGIVEEIVDGQCKIRLIDEYGDEDGYSYFNKEDITKMSIQSAEEKRIEKLYRVNAKGIT